MTSDQGFNGVQIIHPETGGIATVPDTALGLYYAGGWVKLTADNAPPGDPPEGEPAGMSEAQVREGLAKKAGGGDQDAGSGKPTTSKQAAKSAGGKNTEE